MFWALGSFVQGTCGVLGVAKVILLSVGTMQMLILQGSHCATFKECPINRSINRSNRPAMAINRFRPLVQISEEVNSSLKMLVPGIKGASMVSVSTLIIFCHFLQTTRISPDRELVQISLIDLWGASPMFRCAAEVNHNSPRGFWSWPPPPNVDTGCFFTILSLFVCEQGISKSYGQIRTKLVAQVWCVTRTNWLDFGEDPVGISEFLRPQRVLNHRLGFLFLFFIFVLLASTLPISELHLGVRWEFWNESLHQ